MIVIDRIDQVNEYDQRTSDASTFREQDGKVQASKVGFLEDAPGVQTTTKYGFKRLLYGSTLVKTSRGY